MGYYDDRDGRRKSDPMRSADRAPAHAPDWQLHRVVKAQDSSPYTDKKLGLNCGHYEKVRISVVPYDKDPIQDPTAAPGGTQNPNVEVLVWSESAQQFLSFDTAITKTGAGAGVAYMLDVDNVHGALIMIAVTNAIAGVVAISSQGYGLNQTL